ncbi:hypothetical protein E2C01_083992 [Portunus trituberculatus]|uniref:Uncharacterized protein n=1 Tax=Portunus trituberculatus TaxID=210409 RepID=A0A5B7J9H8_PORTR|nr:hypothetical protein [Portunus trituberculatus]
MPQYSRGPAGVPSWVGSQVAVADYYEARRDGNIPLLGTPHSHLPSLGGLGRLKGKGKGSKAGQKKEVRGGGEREDGGDRRGRSEEGDEINEERKTKSDVESSDGEGVEEGWRETN